MQTLLNIVIDGVAYGMVLFVICVGLSLMMGLMKVVNLAHGAFAMIGGYLASYLGRDLGLPYAATLALAVLGTVLVALPLERLLYRRIYASGDPLQQVLMTIGITFVVIGLLNYGFGPTLKVVPLPDWQRGPVDIGVRTLPAHRLFAIASGALIALGLWWLVEQTAFGIRLRAAVDNAAMTAALGVPTERLYVATFALAVGLGAFGGVVGAELLPVEPYYALRHMVTFLVVVSIAGAGSTTAALKAALTLGLIETATRYIAPDWSSLTTYAAVVGIVLALPNGFSAKAQA